MNALDVLRAAAKEPCSVEALDEELSAARGLDIRLDAAIDRCLSGLAALSTTDASIAQFGARRLVELVAVTTQAALMVRFSSSVRAEVFVASRLGPDHGASFGTLGGPAARHSREIVERALTG